ncbi:MAG: hypothetical protein WC683_03860 [bacterium]
MGIVYAIPSYLRAEKQSTLAWLKKSGVPRSMIVIAVQSEADYGAYKERYAGDVRGIIYSPGRNLSENRNAILDWNDGRDQIVQLDDDIKEVVRLERGGKLSLLDNVISFTERGFKEAARIGTPLWGIYPVANPYFMDRKTSTWALCEGTWMGIIECGLRFDSDQWLKEDFEYSCQVLGSFGAILRYDDVAAKANHVTGGGTYWREKAGAMCARVLKKHAWCLRANPRRKDEVLLRRKGGRA